MILSRLRLLLATGLLGAASALAQNTLVRVHTTQGPIDLKLLDAQTPVTVANFLAYVQAGDYGDAMFHRSARLPGGVPFVIQAGGFRWPASGGCCPAVTSRGRIQNEFGADRSNVRGTVAMAKQGGDPNSATSQWFVNLGDNAANLDNQNGGFTVFARVTAPGMAVADRIAGLQVVNAGSPFNELPVANLAPTGPVLRSNVVLITRATVFPPLASQSESDRIFNYLEAAYPEYLVPAQGEPGTFDGYTYRYYSGSNAYVGTKNGKIHYLVPAISGEIRELGDVAAWLPIAVDAGY